MQVPPSPVGQGVRDAPLRDLFARIEPHASLTDPDLPAIAGAMVALAADHDYLVDRIERMGEVSRPEPLHVPERGPRLFLVHRLAGQMSPIHDHGVWVALAPIVGIETHRRYRPLLGTGRERLELVEDLALAPATCITLMPPEDIHDHGHMPGRGDAAYVLILLGDDQFAHRRSEWDPATGRRRVLEPGDRGRWVARSAVPA